MLPFVFQWLDWFGTIVFALSGALVAARHRVDIIGFIMLALVTAIGGGTVRDVILGRTPVFWVHEPLYVWLCLCPAVLVFFWARTHVLNRQWLLWADALGLAVFGVLGCHIALTSNAPAIVAVFMGVITATFGGVLRDILAGEQTLIFRREIYVTAAAFGAGLFWLLQHLGTSVDAAALIAALSAFAVRGAGIYWRLSLPGFKAVAAIKSERRKH